MRLGGTPLTILCTLLLVVTTIPAASAGPQPALACEEGETTHGRIFPNPDQATDFISFEEAQCGLELLEERYPDKIEIKTVAQSVGWMNHATQTHDRFPVYAVEITDETVPMEEKLGNLVFIDSIHGNEKGAREGALRVIEDLLTGKDMAKKVPLATDTSLANTLDQVRLIFTFPNPDGWVHEQPEYRLNDACQLSATCIAGATGSGDTAPEAQSFTRSNGNGTDLNRQYPTTGTPHPSWPAMTEPEIDGQISYFRNLTGETLAGVDLHGMLNAENLTYLMIKDTQRTPTEVLTHEAIAKKTAHWLQADQRLDPWRDTVGPATVWGSTYDLLGYSAPGTGGAFIVQDTGLDAPGFTVEIALNHMAIDNRYPGAGQLMNQLHVAAMRDMTLGFLDYAFDQPGQAQLETDSQIAVYNNTDYILNGRFDTTTANPVNFFTDLDAYGIDATLHDPANFTIDALNEATHFVLPSAIETDAFPYQGLADWVHQGGTLILTDTALETATHDAFQLAAGTNTTQDVTGNVQSVNDHALLNGTHAPVGSLVDGNPLRYDEGTVPNHCLDSFEGDTFGTRNACTVLGQAHLGNGTVRIMGAALPPPVAEGPHGVDGYALTPNGERILLNMLDITLTNQTQTQSTPTTDPNPTPTLTPLLLVGLIGAAALLLTKRRTDA